MKFDINYRFELNGCLYTVVKKPDISYDFEKKEATGYYIYLVKEGAGHLMETHSLLVSFFPLSFKLFNLTSKKEEEIKSIRFLGESMN